MFKVYEYHYMALIPGFKCCVSSTKGFWFDLHVPQDELQYGVIRQFTFSSGLQRMSVVSRKLNGQNFELYTKGAPEMIASLCKPETVPPDFQEKLMSFTKHGYRVIAMAWKELPPKINYVKVQRIPRFVGLNLFSTGKYTCKYCPS